MEKKEPKYFMDDTSFYWNANCPENHITSPIKAPGKVRISIFRGGKELFPSDELPEDIKANIERIDW